MAIRESTGPEGSLPWSIRNIPDDMGNGTHMDVAVTGDQDVAFTLRSSDVSLDFQLNTRLGGAHNPQITRSFREAVADIIKTRNPSSLTTEKRVVDPAVVWGKKYRVPTIVGKGSGRGFELDNLALPLNWEKATGQLDANYEDRFSGIFTRLCGLRHIEPGLVSFCPKTRALTAISLDEVRISLANGGPFAESGEYQTEATTNLDSLIFLQGLVADFLSDLALKLDMQPYAYFGRGQRGGFNSEHLNVPDWCLDTPGFSLHSGYTSKFELRANNLAGRFGQDVKYIQFDNRGFPEAITLATDGGRNYHLASRLGMRLGYDAHNIDSPYEAAALHGIGALFINDMLTRAEQSE